MTRLSRILRGPSRASALAAAVILATAVVLVVAGEGTAAAVVAAVGVVVGVPGALRAAAKPRAGLVWEGRYAEPWRAERSPGELTRADTVQSHGEDREP